MAAQVLSGSGNVSYTNSTGQNVRLVINYLKIDQSPATMSFQGVTVSVTQGKVYGKFRDSVAASSNVPVEIALSNGQTFSITGSASSANVEGYNIIIIPEAG